MTEISDVLVKDGRDWTREDRALITKAIKKQGRESLKAQREELRNDNG